MACAFLTHEKKHPDAAALDLTSKPTGCTDGCGCINCIFGRLGARDMLPKHWPTQYHFLSSPSFQFDHNSNTFKPYEPHKEQTRKSLEPSEMLPNKIRRTSSDISLVSPRRSFQSFPQHHLDDFRKSPTSPVSSNRSSPIAGSYHLPSFPRVTPEPFGHQPFDATQFGSQHLPLRMLSPQQLSLNAWFTLHPSKTSPTSIISSPERPVSSEVPNEDTRSGSSSPVARSLTSPDPLNAAPTNQNAAAVQDDKNSIYWQRRLRNNLAAKRSRDLRREREDKIAANCLRMDDIRQRLMFIRSQYIKLLS